MNALTAKKHVYELVKLIEGAEGHDCTFKVKAEYDPNNSTWSVSTKVTTKMIDDNNQERADATVDMILDALSDSIAEMREQRRKDLKARQLSPGDKISDGELEFKGDPATA